jgi:hypothetical protein
LARLPIARATALCAGALVVAMALPDAWAQEAAEPSVPRRTGIAISINDGNTIEAQPGAITIQGTTNAPTDSIVSVSIEGATQTTVVREGGDWSVSWSSALPAGRHAVDVSISAPDGQTGSARQVLVVAGTPTGTTSVLPPPPPPPPAKEKDFLASTDRWRIAPPPYEINTTPGRWNPYEQRTLKGDKPIRGDKLFLALTGISDTLVEPRTLPTPAGVSTADRDIDFFGEPEQFFAVQNFVGSIDLFSGDTAFRPIDWRIKATFFANLNYLRVEENAIVKPDVRRGTTRTDEAFAIQELFFEKKLADLGPNFDFISFRVGIQPFTSDFRGFIFSDMNLGVRVFGNLHSNRYQYNLAYFDRLEKDTNSGLNKLEFRDQRVVVANLYRQDTFARGHTIEVSIHYLRDDATFVFDENGFLARPDPTGDFTPHGIEATYLGFASLGHAGRFNIDSAAYYVFGTDELNPIAGRELVMENGAFRFIEEVDIKAWMAALEVSYDRDWLRPRLAFFAASGDDNLNDRDAEGFDSIFDNPNFAGGGFSFFNRAGIRLAGTGVALVNRGSLLPDLTSSKDEGQPNFVNPGLYLASAGLDVEFTPKVKGIFTANYLRFAQTEVLEGLLFQAPIRTEIGWDISAGVRYRPFLNQNFVVVFGAATLLPGRGYEDIYETDDPLYQAFTSVTLTF